jgi:PadR family transcriptional regulator PadR
MYAQDISSELKRVGLLRLRAHSSPEPVLFSPELKKGSTELLLLSLLEARPRHGYEIGKLIEARSAGKLQFQVSSLYPTLNRLEEGGMIAGRWVEEPGQRRRRFYRLTKRGLAALSEKRATWHEYVATINLVIEPERVKA